MLHYVLLISLQVGRFYQLPHFPSVVSTALAQKDKTRFASNTNLRGLLVDTIADDLVKRKIVLVALFCSIN